MSATATALKVATVTEVFGDGEALIWFRSFGTPDGYWLVRVDSSWDLSNWGAEPHLIDHVDDICAAIEEEFGCGECHYCGGVYGNAGCDECRDEPESKAAFPRFVYGAGVYWGLEARTDTTSKEGRDG